MVTKLTTRPALTAPAPIVLPITAGGFVWDLVELVVPAVPAEVLLSRPVPEAAGVPLPVPVAEVPLDGVPDDVGGVLLGVPVPVPLPVPVPVPVPPPVPAPVPLPLPVPVPDGDGVGDPVAVGVPGETPGAGVPVARGVPAGVVPAGTVTGVVPEPGNAVAELLVEYRS